MSPTPMFRDAGLDALEARLAEDLDALNLPARPWVRPPPDCQPRARDVVVIGAGMCGLAVAAQLKLLGIVNVVCLDRAEPGREGPWMTTARMRTLRSPKVLPGPALGFSALTFRAWFEAQFGRAAWDELDKVPRPQWMDYLVWYRRVLDLPVRNGVAVTAVEPGASGLISLTVTDPDGKRSEAIVCRHLVLATGRDGLGGPHIPEFARGLDRRFWAHTGDEIDFTRLRGKRVGVIGAGASAIDNAAVALETGAARVDLFIRRPDLPRVNKFTGIGSPGVVHGFAGLPDEWKWRFLHYVMSEQTPPPSHSVRRVSAHANAHFHLDSPVLGIVHEDDALTLTTPGCSWPLDFLILGTGFAVDLGRRPELAAMAPHICLWRDRYRPPPGLESEELGASPYLGPSFEFQERVPGSCPALSRIHCFNFPATLSHGKLSGDIPAVSEGVGRLCRGIARSLFVEDRDHHFESLRAYDTPELDGSEWIDAARRTRAHA